MTNLLSLILFTSSILFMPGPNAMMLMSTGVNFGFKKGISHGLGVSIGFTAMGILVSIGIGFLFEKFPHLHSIIRIIGLIYLIYLAWLIAGRPGFPKNKQSPEEESETPAEKNRITFWKGALFQWINPQAWIVISGAIASFTSPDKEDSLSLPVIIAVFLLMALISSFVWLFFGTGLKRFLDKPPRRRIFNYVMAGLLILSIVPVVYDMVKDRLG